ncbi:MAG: hypothetical protein PHH22_02195 [Clostridia bacterium]|nr:hypothetical protein [Clostridia bacterium]
MEISTNIVVFQIENDDTGYELVDLGSGQSKNNDTYLYNEKSHDENNINVER